MSQFADGVSMSPEPTRRVADSLMPVFESIMNHAVHFSGTDKIASPSGQEQAWLIDLRSVLYRPEILSLIAEEFWGRLASAWPFQVCGLETAAIPIVTAILLEGKRRGYPVTGFIIRKERKTSGLGRAVEGPVTDLPVLIADDLFNSGASFRRVFAVLAEYGLTAKVAFIVLNFEARRGRHLLNQKGMQVFALFRLGDFGLGLAEAPGNPVDEEYEDVWAFRAGPANPVHVVPKSAPVFVAPDRVLYATDDGHLWCLSAASGEIAWAFTVQKQGGKNIFSTPAVANGVVYFGSYDGNVYALDLMTGREIWRNPHADWIGSSPVLCRENVLVIGLEYALRSRRGSIAGFDMRTGELAWECTSQRYVHASGAYASCAGCVGIGSNEGSFRCIDVVTGKVRWERNVGSPIKQGAIFSQEHGCFLFGTADGALMALGSEEGREHWSYTTDNMINATPATDGDTVIVGSTDKFVHFVDIRTGTCVKKRNVHAKVLATPVVSDRILLGTTSGHLLAFSRKTYRITGRYQFSDRIANAVAIDPITEVIFVPLLDNSLRAVRLSSGANVTEDS